MVDDEPLVVDDDDDGAMLVEVVLLEVDEVGAEDAVESEVLGSGVA